MPSGWSLPRRRRERDDVTEPVRIVIAGGGSAGWMAAAAFARFLPPSYRVTLVESDAIGTVGVGEATIPQIRLFNSALGLDEDRFLSAVDGTLKLGIEFDGWRRAGHRYMHAFGPVGRVIEGNPFHHYWLRARAGGAADGLDAYSLNEIAARAGRVRRSEPVTAPTVPDMPYAYHFDAARYAALLRSVAEEGGVVRTEGRIDRVDCTEFGDVAALVLEDGTRIEGDLFVDCTGFRALLIGETLGVRFEDWSRWLPADRALAVPSERAADPVPYTRAIAHGAGWQWRIPLQSRTGNGLVYSSGFLSDDEAAATLLANLDGEALADPRPVRFATGRRTEPWRRNVVALGLAAGFLEPLESTSIHLIQSGIQRLLALLPGRAIPASLSREFNRQSAFEWERVRDFIVLHYRATERPEPLWQAVRDQAPPDSLAQKLDLWRDAATIVREHEELFTEEGWLQVLIGQGVEPARWHPAADLIPMDDLAEYMRLVEALYRREAAALPSHRATIARHFVAKAA